MRSCVVVKVADSNQWVIASRALFIFHLNKGILSSAITTRSIVYFPLERGNIILGHNHQGIIGVADIYPQWDILLQDVIKGNIPKQISKTDPCGTPQFISFLIMHDTVSTSTTQSRK